MNLRLILKDTSQHSLLDLAFVNCCDIPDETNYFREYSHSLVEEETDSENDEFNPVHDDATPSGIIDINSMMYLRKESPVSTATEDE